MKFVVTFLIFTTIHTFGFGGNNPGENIKSDLKWNICEANLDSVHKKLGLTILKKFSQSTYFLDTKNKDLLKNKYTIRLDKQNNKWSSDLRMNYNDPREIPDFIPPSMTCEKNYYKDEKFLSCKVHHKKASLETPLSHTQEDYLEEKLKKDINAIFLEKTGSFEGTSMKVKYPAQNKKNLTLTIEEIKGQFIQISTRVDRLKDDVFFEELSEFFKSKNLQLCPEQKNQPLKL